VLGADRISKAAIPVDNAAEREYIRRARIFSL
jgi:hypothetical protein